MHPAIRNPSELVVDRTAREMSLVFGIAAGVVAGSAAWFALRSRVGGWGILLPVVGAFGAWSSWGLMHALAPEAAQRYWPA